MDGPGKSQPGKPRSDESALIRRIKAGDDAAFSELVGRFKEKLFRLAYGITLDLEESQDIVQEVFLKAFQSIGGFKAEASLATWLHRITVNHCLNWKRRLRRRFKWRHQPLEREDGSERPELIAESDNPDHQYGQKEFEDIFEKAFASLPAEARAVFVLKELDGLSYDEIAESLGIKRGTVSSRLFYARRRLREVMAPYLCLAGRREEPGTHEKARSSSRMETQTRERQSTP